MTLEIIVRKHFNKALVRGWLPHFSNEAQRQKQPLDLILAIASRETNMENIKGDFRDGYYHGFGVMQVDIGTAPDWCKAGKWKDIKEAIHKGIEILTAKGKELQRYIDADNKTVDYETFLWIQAASYNHGSRGSYRDWKQDGSPDKFTTGKNYGRDVLNRAEIFRALIEKHEKEHGDILAATIVEIEEGQAEANTPLLSPEEEDTVNEAATIDPVKSAPVAIENVETIKLTANMPVAGGEKEAEPLEITATQPLKSGGLKAIIASITTALTAIGIGSLEDLQFISGQLKTNPLIWLISIVVFVVIVLVYWKFMDRQTKLDLQREAHAHDLSRLNAQTLSDPSKINVVVKPK